MAMNVHVHSTFTRRALALSAPGRSVFFPGLGALRTRASAPNNGAKFGLASSILTQKLAYRRFSTLNSPNMVSASAKKSALAPKPSSKDTAPTAQEHSHSHKDTSDRQQTEENKHEHSHDSSNEHSHEHGSLFHLHLHSHQHNELLGKGFLTNPAVRITWIGLVVNVLMAGAKGAGGVYFHSQALIADAIHSVSDMIADFLTLATVNVALKEGTFTKYPLGYGKIESVGAFAVAGVLLFAGFTVGWSSLLQIGEIFLPANVYEYLLVLQVHSHSHVSLGHSHSHDSAELSEISDRVVPNINAAWLALGSIGIKEVLYRKTMQVANQTNSKVLVANAWHHRVDSLTAGVAFITVTSGVLLGFTWLDAVGGLLVSVLILKAGWGSFKDAWYELVDRGVEPTSSEFTQIRLIVDSEVDSVSQAMETGFQLTDFSVLAAGARTNLILRLSTSQNLALATINSLERDLVAGIREKDKSIGKVFVEYSLKDKHEDNRS